MVTPLVAVQITCWIRPQDFLQNYIKSKRSLFRRVSSKILFNEKQDDKIEEFVHDLDRTGGWMAGQREAFAKAYLKRVDRSRMNHCAMRFESGEQLAQHKNKCPFRPLMCDNDGCGEAYSALHLKAHQGTCLFKPLACEQRCNATILRGEMTDHCSTNCPMKPVNCPFYDMGCITVLTKGTLEQHCLDVSGVHIQCLMHTLQKQEISMGNQGKRLMLLEKAVSISQRPEAADASSICSMLRQQEARIASVEQEEVAKLRAEMKGGDVWAAEMLQLRRELRNVSRSSRMQDR